MARQLRTFEGGTATPVLLKTEQIPDPPPKSDAPLTIEELAEILIAKAAIDQADIDAKKAAR